MPEPTQSGAACAVTYVLFNGAWDRIVANQVDQLGRPVRPDADPVPGYLEYLRGSLRSLAETHAGELPTVRVWLVEIEPGRLEPDALRAALADAVPELAVSISFVGHGLVRPFVDEALAIPPGHYRSPNRLHEALLFFALRHTAERYVLFVDPDVTFLAPRAVPDLVARLAAEPRALAAGFLEPARRRPWRDEVIWSRERLHSVACLFDAEAMRRDFPIDVFARCTTLDERLAPIRDPERTEHYARYRVLDTLSLFTEWARASWQADRIVALDRALERYAETSMLTIACEPLVHSKYLHPDAFVPLEAAIAQARLTSTPLLERLRARAAASAGRPAPAPLPAADATATRG